MKHHLSTKKSATGNDIRETEENFTLMEDLQIHYLELTKLPKENDIASMNALEFWLTFIKEAGQQGSEARLKKITERSAIIKMAMERLETISADEKMRAIQRSREMARRDLLSQIYHAKQEGIEKGIEKEAERVVIASLKEGLTEDVIAKITGIDVEKILKIKEEGMH